MSKHLQICDPGNYRLSRIRGEHVVGLAWLGLAGWIILEVCIKLYRFTNTLSSQVLRHGLLALLACLLWDKTGIIHPQRSRSALAPAALPDPIQAERLSHSPP
jgi:hypothetical protein